MARLLLRLSLAGVSTPSDCVSLALRTVHMNAGAKDTPRAADDIVAVRLHSSRRVIVVGSLIIDVVARVATRNQRPLSLRSREFALLVYLAENVEVPVSRNAIARDVWGDAAAVWTNVITVTISGLRRELERPGLPKLLHTVRGIGYLLGGVPR